MTSERDAAAGQQEMAAEAPVAAASSNPNDIDATQGNDETIMGTNESAGSTKPSGLNTKMDNMAAKAVADTTGIQIIKSAPGNMHSGGSRVATPARRTAKEAPLPAISSFAFADIFKTIDDKPEIQTAINGIAEIYQKKHISFPAAVTTSRNARSTDGITRSRSSRISRTHLFRRTGARQVLATVPEASSSSSGSHNRLGSSIMSDLFALMRQRDERSTTTKRKMRIGRMGRSIAVGVTTALMTSTVFPETANSSVDREEELFGPMYAAATTANAAQESEARSSLRRLLEPVLP